MLPNARAAIEVKGAPCFNLDDVISSGLTNPHDWRTFLDRFYEIAEKIDAGEGEAYASRNDPTARLERVFGLLYCRPRGDNVLGPVDLRNHDQAILYNVVVRLSADGAVQSPLAGGGAAWSWIKSICEDAESLTLSGVWSRVQDKNLDLSAGVTRDAVEAYLKQEYLHKLPPRKADGTLRRGRRPKR